MLLTIDIATMVTLEPNECISNDKYALKIASSQKFSFNNGNALFSEINDLTQATSHHFIKTISFIMQHLIKSILGG